VPIISYFDQLQVAAKHLDYPLKQAFVDAGVETSTFYRTRLGSNLRLVTASRVMAALDHQPDRQTTGKVKRGGNTPSLHSGWVDLEAGVIHRQGSAETKTKKRRGAVRMGRKLAGHMARFCARSDGHVIEYRGRPVTGIWDAWVEACTLAGLEGVTPHTLKHTAITWAIANGMSREDAAGYFSTSIQTIETTYWHHSPHYQKAAADITDKKAR